jgi:hypothetical protein
MKLPAVPVVAVTLLAWAALPSPAQEKLPQPQEKPPVVETPPPLVGPCCPTECRPECNGLRVRWAECDVPIHVLVPREVTTEQKRPTVEIAYRAEKRKVTDMVLKPKEITCEVPCTTLRPFQDICPHTGECKTVWKPCTEMKVQKQTVYVSVPEERTVTVQIPYLKPAEEVVVQKTILLEYKTELQKKGFAVPVPGPELPRDRWIITPQPCAPPPACGPHQPH